VRAFNLKLAWPFAFHSKTINTAKDFKAVNTFNIATKNWPAGHPKTAEGQEPNPGNSQGAQHAQGALRRKRPKLPRIRKALNMINTVPAPLAWYSGRGAGGEGFLVQEREHLAFHSKAANTVKDFNTVDIGNRTNIATPPDLPLYVRQLAD
jgi:hypothetical protein